MKLKKIEIVNFGQLSNLSFDLPSSKLNVFFGKNEAGKSTTVAFIKQVLFGFYLRSNSAPFFEDYKPLAHVSPMGGSLYFEDEKSGDRYKLERLWAKGDKTKRGILTVKKDGEVVPESVFFDKIHNIDGDFYADSFIFNQEMLGQVAGLRQNDLLERIYYLGATNSNQLLEERDSFNKEASKLFKKTGKKPEVNRLLKELAQKRNDLTQSQDEFVQYKDLHKKFDTQNDELNKVKQEFKDLNTKKEHLTDLGKDLENYQNLKKLQTEIHPVKFASENYQKAQSLTTQEKNLQTTISDLKMQLEKIGSTSEKDYSELLQKKPEILQLQAEDRSYRQRADQIKAEEEQILALNPEVGQFINFDDAQIQQLKKDYEELPDKIENHESTNSANKNTLIIIGVVVALVGLISIGVLGFSAFILIVLGIGIGIFGFYQKNKFVKQEKFEKEKAQQINQKWANFTQKYNLKANNLDINNLVLQLSQYKLKLKAENDNTLRLNEINKELNSFATNLEQELSITVEPEFSAVLTALDKLNAMQVKLQQQNNKKEEIAANLQNDQAHLKELRLQLGTVLAEAGVKNIAEYEDLYQDYLAQTKVKTQIESIKSSLGKNLAELEKVNEDSAKYNEQVKDLSTKIAQKDAQVADLQSSLAKTKLELDNLADSSKVFLAKQNLANTETEFVNASQEYLANLLAAKWISRALDIASNERFPKMLESAKEYFKLLTGGRYVDIILDKKLTVVRKDGKKREVKYLSRGTGEQLYFALKLAFVEQIKDKINLPILIDDSFVNFDDQRISYIEQLLQKLAEHNQVLIFTAQENLVEKLALAPLTFERKTNA